MPGTADPARRASPGRTTRAAVEVWALTVVAHTATGGGAPSLPWLVGVAGLVALATGWVLRGSVRIAAMLPVLVLAQVGLHLALARMAPPGHSAAGHAHLGHAHTASSPWWAQELSVRMVAAHVLCAVLTAAIWWLRRWVVHVVLSLTRAGGGAVRRPAGVGVPDPGPWRAGQQWLVADPGRAPPVGLATA